MTDDHWWRICLRLKLRQSSGDAFQDFFSKVMSARHGDDFVRVRSFGAKGDKGCDGYLRSSGKLYQCYGAVGGSQGKVDYLINKMDSDFCKAKTRLSSIMNVWSMVHNLVDGLPIEAVEKLKELESNNQDIAFRFFGLEGFEALMQELTGDDRIWLLGPAATNQDFQDLQVEELKLLIDAVIANTTTAEPVLVDLTPVSVTKLEANDLPAHWKSLVLAGWQNAHVVAAYLDEHYDTLRGERIGHLFSSRYQYLRSQGLNSESIMDRLYEYVTGIGTVRPSRQVAAQALLAYLFEHCNIFENLATGRL